jgi:hypothetical protein
MTLSPTARRRIQQAIQNKATAEEIIAAIDENVAYTVLEERLTLTNAVKKDMTASVPIGAVILSVHANAETLIVGDASGDNLADRWAIGITGNVAKYGAAASLVKNQKVSKIPAHAVLAAAEQLGVYAVKADGSTAATEKFTAGGIVLVRVCYVTPVLLRDAA